MPTGLDGEKRTRDLNQLARKIIRNATGQESEPPPALKKTRRPHCDGYCQRQSIPS